MADTSLDDCQQACMSDNQNDGKIKCTAINWKFHSNECILRACSIKAPDWNYKAYEGYKIVLRTNPVLWENSEKIWSDAACPYIGSLNNVSLDSCKRACLAKKRCTAINWRIEGGRGCILRACPMTPATLKQDKWQGHKIKELKVNQ